MILVFTAITLFIVKGQEERVKSKKGPVPIFSFFEPRKRKGKYIPPPDHPWRRHNPSLHHNSYLERVI